MSNYNQSKSTETRTTRGSLTYDQVMYLRDQHDKWQETKDPQYHWKESAKHLGLGDEFRGRIKSVLIYQTYKYVI